MSKQYLLKFLVATFLLFALPSAALAQSGDSPNTLSLEGSPWSRGAYDTNSDGYYSGKGVSAWTLRGSYARSFGVFRLGVGVGYVRVPGDISLSIIRPHILAGVWAPVGNEKLEFGGDVRFGGEIASLSLQSENIGYVGISGSLGVGVRYWLNPRIGVGLSGEVWFGTSTTGGGHSVAYFNNGNLLAISVGPIAGLLVRF